LYLDKKKITLKIAKRRKVHRKGNENVLFLLTPFHVIVRIFGLMLRRELRSLLIMKCQNADLDIV